MLRIGIFGFGFMGRMHYASYKKLGQVEVVAICDIKPDIVEITKQAQGNIEGADDSVDFNSFKLYRDFDKLLENEQMDAVSIALPTYLHAEFSQIALKAGLHVFCEKPMALNISQCAGMIAVCETSGKVLQIGHCIRFWPEYAKAKEIIDSGRYGRVIAAAFQRFGTMPAWGDNWFAKDELSGGMPMDLHIHDSDFVQYLFGMPISVCSSGVINDGGAMNHISSRYDYDDNKLVTAEGSWAMTPSFGFQMSFNIVMEKAVLVYDCTRDPAFKIYPAQGQAFTPEVAAGDGYSLELEHFIGLINGKKMPEVITLEQSMNSVRLVQAEIDSVKKNAKVFLT